ncbi:COG3014 family protein [Marinifilum sp.]|uniref:COG3014 family protein n=1 Tax=Marinifilum sp. TaxID=2033137 RepID=UPI003BAC8B27
MKPTNWFGLEIKKSRNTLIDKHLKGSIGLPFFPLFAMNKLFTNKAFFLLVFISSLFLSGCATYYAQNEAFNQYFLTGDITNAERTLDQDAKNHRNKNRSLYLLNKGTLAWMQQDYQKATNYFNEADLFIEDQRKNIANEALALLTNPATKPYVPEDFENVMLNFYKALSYLEMGNTGSALVECRRVNEKLYALNDKYPKNFKNRYSDDAFAHVLMGLIYDSTKDYNNAFIAYRNALKIYEENYTKNFGTAAPLQLKEDLLRTAYQTGLTQEYEFYREQFGFDYIKAKKKEGDLVFIWLTGLGPVKDEWSINFSALNGTDGYLTMASEGEDLNFPFYVGDMDNKTRNSLNDLEFVRVAFPKYAERIPLYTEASVIVNDSLSYPLDKAEDINAIAFKTLRDRMLREMANSLLRLATKKALENYARSQDDTVGFLVGVLNAVTEKADTRNWQTLPYSIHYSRIRLKEGENNLILQVNSPDGLVKNQNVQIQIKSGETSFYTFQNMETN